MNRPRGMSRNFRNRNQSHTKDRTVWVAYSDLSTVLMLSFMFFFIMQPQENKKIKEKVDRDTESQPINNQQNEFNFN